MELNKNNLRKQFAEKIEKSKKLQDIYQIISDGKGTYIDAEEYAYEMGSLLSELFSENLSSDVLPNGKMSRELAEELIRPLLKDDYDLISTVTAQVQNALNEKADIHLKAQTAPMNADKVDGLINKVVDADVYDDVSWVLDELVKNYSQSVVSDVMKANVNFHGKVGMRPRIIREAESNCCKWCLSLEGVYEYPDVPEDVYRRHERCRCTVEYDPGGGKKYQNVHTKQWQTAEERAKIKERIQMAGLELNRNKRFPINPSTGEIYIAHSVKITDEQFGAKLGRHAKDFDIDPTKPEQREEFRKIIDNIIKNADERCYGSWRDQEFPVLFHILNDDVVVESKKGEFITILKGGISNERVKNARNRRI